MQGVRGRPRRNGAGGAARPGTEPGVGAPGGRVASAGHVAWLDGVRALAAVFVVLHHCWLAVYPAFPRNAGPAYVGWMLYGHLAVVVFIVVSGYSLTRSPARHGNRLPGGWRAFARRRFWRIVPPYWVALVASMPFALWVTGGIHGSGAAARAFVVHALLLQDVIGSQTPNGAFWSIAVEAWIYCLFPGLLALRRRVGAPATAALTVAGVGLVEAAATQTSALAHYDYLTPQLLACFALGMLAADNPAGRPRPARPRPFLAAAGVLAVAGGVLMAVAGSVRVVADYFWVDIAVGAITALAFRGLATAPRSRLRALLGARRLAAVGLFSYSIYLVHPLVIDAVWALGFDRLAAGPGTLALLVAVVVPAALAGGYGFFLLVERRFVTARSWAEVHAGGRRAASEPAAAPTSTPVPEPRAAPARTTVR